MNDSFSRTSTEGWFSRIGNSIKNVLVGLVLFVAAFPLLFVNEGCAVRAAKSLAEFDKVKQTISPDDVANAEGKAAVHMTGEATTTESLTDPIFGVSSENTIALERSVEMYQWVEEEKTEKTKNTGGSETTKTTFSYSKQWSRSFENSANFDSEFGAGYDNPASMEYSNETTTAKIVTIGAFKLNNSLIGKIKNFESISVDQEVVDALTKEDDQPKKNIQLHSGGLYIGKNPSAPEIGDFKIAFRIVKPTTVSLMAAPHAGSFKPYHPETGPARELLKVGTHTADEMIAAAAANDSMMKWLGRGGGFLMMAIGLSLVFGPLSVLADVLPILGNIVGAGTTLVAVLIAAACSLLTIAVAWLFYRPLIGIALLLVAGAAAAAVIYLLRKAKSDPEPEAA